MNKLLSSLILLWVAVVTGIAILLCYPVTLLIEKRLPDSPLEFAKETLCRLLHRKHHMARQDSYVHCTKCHRFHFRSL